MDTVEADADPRRIRLARNIRNLTRALSDAASAERALQQEIARQRAELGRERARAGAAAGEPCAATASRGHAAVVVWDMGHNPVGRALVLYQLLSRDWDVELIGPAWSRYGAGLWEPLASLDLNARFFACNDLSDFLPQAMLHATRRRFDLVCVCKPRLPSMMLGLMIKEHSGCPLVLDIDDHELSFFKDSTPADFGALTAAGMNALREPYEELATRFCETLVPDAADAVTVSNVALRRKFGGHIVRHARDETAFAPGMYDCAAVRRELGIAEDEFALVFVGTPRAHKGIFDVARALHELEDPGFSLHIVGDITDRRVTNEFRRYPKARVKFHPNCSFADLPRILSAADAVPLLQDPEHPIASFQVPGKLSDATALGLPVLVTDVPPIADLTLLGGLTVVRPERLAEELRALRSRHGAAERQRIREFFVGELSLSVNRTRLQLAVDAACAGMRPLPPVYPELKALLLRCFNEIVRNRQVEALSVSAKPSAPPRGSAEQLRDVVFFWKQNDTGLYGRRSDMIVKYLLKSGRIGRVMQFDAPLSADRLQSYRVEGAEPTLLQNALILRNTLTRMERGFDTRRLKQRVFVHAGGEVTSLYGRELLPEAEYVRFVTDELSQADFDPERTLAWVCPVVWQFPEIARAVPFYRVVADIIDDQRNWPAPASYKERLDRSYRETLGRADIVLTNCAPVADAFAAYADPIHVVPNGAEPFDEIPPTTIPARLAQLPRPIIGYAGNLRDRIDWDLLSAVAARRPDWSLVLAGSSHDNPSARNLARFANVTLLGVIEYSELVSYLRAFDVGIVPHISNRLTETMNPLKVYNYFAAGLPIVSTEVANIDDLRPFIRTANDPDNFIEAIEFCLAQPATESMTGRREALWRINWETRVADMLAVIERF